MNLDPLGKNQYLRYFTFRTHLRKLIRANKFFRIDLRKLLGDQSFKFIFTGFCYWIFSNDKEAQYIFAKINTCEI